MFSPGPHTLPLRGIKRAQRRQSVGTRTDIILQDLYGKFNSFSHVYPFVSQKSLWAAPHNSSDEGIFLQEYFVYFKKK